MYAQGHYEALAMHLTGAYRLFQVLQVSLSDP
jgi:hypothetical protein